MRIKIKVELKVKGGKLKKFKIDTSSIASAFNDDRLNNLELVGRKFK